MHKFKVIAIIFDMGSISSYGSYNHYKWYRYKYKGVINYMGRYKLLQEYNKAAFF